MKEKEAFTPPGPLFGGRGEQAGVVGTDRLCRSAQLKSDERRTQSRHMGATDRVGSSAPGGVDPTSGTVSCMVWYV